MHIIANFMCFYFSGNLSHLIVQREGERGLFWDIVVKMHQLRNVHLDRISSLLLHLLLNKSLVLLNNAGLVQLLR